jgi:hypothetical protein
MVALAEISTYGGMPSHPALRTTHIAQRTVYHVVMETGDLRKRILHALDSARKDSSDRRRVVDEATKAYDDFLANIAGPLVKQAASVLTAEGQRFVADTPAGSVRLTADGSPQTFLELQLDTTGGKPRVIGRVSVTRGRQGLIVEERPVADKAVGELAEDDVAKFLIAEIPKLVVKS